MIWSGNAADSPVSAHDGDESAAGELINSDSGHVNTTHITAKFPRLEQVRGDEEGYPYEEALVSNGQVHDVYVGHCLHFGEPQDHINDQSVA